MGVFANKSVRVTHPEYPNSAIFIRPHMTIGMRNAMLGAAKVNPRTSEITDMDINEVQEALYIAGVVGWEGPEFDGEPCTPENVRSLPSDHPLVEATFNEMKNRYQAKRDPK